MKKLQFKKSHFLWLTIGILAAVIIVPNLFSYLNPVDPVVVPPTQFEFLVVDYVSGNETDDDDHDIQMYRAVITDLTADAINEFTFADYTLDTAKDSGEKYTPDYSKYLYYSKLNGSDIDEYWFVPQLGLNTLYAMNSTEDVAMICYSVDELSSTVNQTNYDEWHIIVQTLDDTEGTGVATIGEGYAPYYDFEDDADYSLVLRIEFNVTTAALSYCDWESTYSVIESVSTKYIFYEIDVVLLGELVLDIDFSSGLGDTFEVIGMSIGHGNAGAFTAWDAQN